MRKSKNIIGKDVISHFDGEKLNSVKDLIIGSDDTVLALLVSEGGLLSSARIVPFEKVLSFGKDAVVIEDNKSVIAVDTYPAANDVVATNDKLMGKKVFTEDGANQGNISDVYFDDVSAQVLGYEVSGGILNNIAKGTSYLPVDDIVNIGPDVVLIRVGAADALQAQVGGVQGALQSAGDTLSASANKEQDPEVAVIGQRARTEVEDDSGSTIAASGQRITRDIVEDARSKGKLPQLLAAAGVGPTQQAGGDAAAAMGQAGDTIGQAADKAGSLWDQFTRKISELTDSAGKRADEQLTRQRLSDIADAVGRPVTKVILDRQDNVILNMGDIITHEAIQKAYDGGELDSLLASAYKGEVSFGKEEMMTSTEGHSTIEKASGNAPVIEEMQQKVDQAQQERQDEKEQKKNEAEDKRQGNEEQRQQRAAEREPENQTSPDAEPQIQLALPSGEESSASSTDDKPTVTEHMVISPNNQRGETQ